MQERNSAGGGALGETCEALHANRPRSSFYYAYRRTDIATPRLSPLELKVLEILWGVGASSVREIQERFPNQKRPAYTTVQTILYRLETKAAVRRVKKIGNAHIFEAVISTSAARRRLVDEVLALFGGRSQPLISHLIESGQLTLEDIEEARKTLRSVAKKGKKGQAR